MSSTIEKHWGKGLLQRLQLPADVFPPGSSFADSPLGENEAARQEAAQSLAHGPARHANETVYDSTSRDTAPSGPLGEAFDTINARFTRSRADTRGWSRTQKKQLQGRLPCGGMLLIAETLQEDGTLSPPLLLIAGPFAFPLEAKRWVPPPL